MLVARSPASVREIVGYIVCWRVVDELHILDLATLRSRRRKGIARQLVLAALREGFNNGVRRAFLEVRASNSAAFALYENLGFIRTQVREAYYDKPIEDAVVMSLEQEGLNDLFKG